jgi:hydroxymethylpyrimidine pyrophosphatase-like HAD family hydrolase
MTHRAFAIDLDGTLLGSDHQVSPANREAVEKAIDAGFDIIIATARWYQLALEVADVLQLAGPAIACSGAEVRRLSDGADLFDVRVPAEFAHQIFSLCDDIRCIVWAPLDDAVLFKLDGDPPPGMPPGIRHVPKLTGAADVAPRMVLVQGNTAISRVVDELAGEWSDRVRFVESISSDTKSILTLTSTGADKGAALAVACKELDIHPTQVVAIGDAQNDVEMFRVAGTSFAMGQASEMVKAAATRVTAPNDQDGVAQAIHTVLRETAGA